MDVDTSGSSAPARGGLEADDDELEDVPPGSEQGALGAFYDGPDEDAPPDAVGPRPPVDADFTERDLRVPGVLEATEAAERAALSGELGSEAFLARMQAAEEAYERDHAGGSSLRPHRPVGAEQTSVADSQPPASPGSPRSPRAVADATRERVRAQLAAALAVNPRLPGCLGDPAVAAAAAAQAEARLFEVSHSAKTIYQSAAANAVRLAGNAHSVEELVRVAAGEPRALVKGGNGGPDVIMYVEGVQGVGLKAEG